MEKLNYSSPFDHFYFELNESRLTFVILQTIIGSVTIVGSVIVLVLFYVTRKNSSGSARKYFIALAVSDLQGGVLLTTMFLYAARAPGLLVNDPYCIESISVMTYTLLFTLLLLVSMTIDRYFAILYPLKHKYYSNDETTNGVIVGCWILACANGFCCYITQHEYSPHPGVLCFVTKERVNDYFSGPCILFIVCPSIVTFLFGYMKMFRTILTSVGNTFLMKNYKKFKNY